MSEFKVSVENVGIVYSGPSEDYARKKYDWYVSQSKFPNGVWGCFRVAMFSDGVAVAEHEPSESELEQKNATLSSAALKEACDQVAYDYYRVLLETERQVEQEMPINELLAEQAVDWITSLSIPENLAILEKQEIRVSEIMEEKGYRRIKDSASIETFVTPLGIVRRKNDFEGVSDIEYTPPKDLGAIEA